MPATALLLWIASALHQSSGPPSSGVVPFDGAELARLAGKSGATSLTLSAGETVTLELTGPTKMASAGLWWSGSLGSAEERLPNDGGATATWYPVVEDHDQAPEVVGTDRPAGSMRVAALVTSYAKPGDTLQLRITGPSALQEVRLVWIAPANSIAELPQDPPLQSAANYPKPFVYSRAQWGAVAPACSSGYCTTTHVAIHHSASSSHLSATTFAQCASNVKGIQTYHMVTNGWCDIGYNYLACHHGDLFEGRAGGDDVKGAHDGFNCGSMGICALGYFHAPYNQVVPATMRQSIEKLAAWKCSQQNINPLGSSYYTGYGSTMNNVYGHRDVKSTACPGDNLYALLPAIRTNIQGLLNNPGGSAGTLKGVLYNAVLGVTARISGGTVCLVDGTSVITGADGYYEFPLPVGTHKVAATAAGFTAGWSQDTVSSGDVWESLGLQPSPSQPVQTSTSLGNGLFQCSWQGDPGTSVLLVYALAPGIPVLNTGAYGLLWPNLSTATLLPLGNAPGNGVKVVNLQAPNISGLSFQIQGFVTKSGQQKLTNGAALIVP